MRAIRARTATCAYDVDVMWGEGALLATQHVADGSGFMLWSEPPGEAAQRGFVVDDAWMGAASHRLVSTHEGSLVVHGAQAEVPLRVGQQATVSFGPLSFRVTATEPRTALAARGSFDPRRHLWTAASFALHGLAIACMALMPPKASSMSIDLLDEDVRYSRYLATPIAREPIELPWRDDEQAGEPEPAAARHAGGEGEAGRRDASREPKRAAIAGTSDRRAPGKAEPVDARSAGLLGVLASASGRLAMSSPYASDTPLGYDPRDALGKLFGGDLGESSGFGGIGLRGPGRGGGGDATGTIGTGRLDTGSMVAGIPSHDGMGSRRRNERLPPSLRGVPEVRGGLSKEAIRRTIHRHLAEVRFCYESALARSPELEGRVAVSFLIAPSGVVQSTAVASSSLGSASAEACLCDAVRRWAFPAPDGGGYVQVTYPFSFERAAE